MVDRLRVNRKDLEKILGNDPRLIKAFEDLFTTTRDDNTNHPIEIDAINVLVNTAASDAATALELIGALKQIAELSLFTNRNAEALDQIAQLKDYLEKSLMAVPVENRKPILDYIDFSLNPAVASKTGRVFWSNADDTLTICHSNGVNQQVGEELYAYITNTTASTINNGEVIGLTGTGTTITRYIADGTLRPIYAIGIATESIPVGARGRITTFGRVRALDTSSFTAGQIYASATVAGALTQAKPTAPNISVPIGVVTVVSATQGEIFVRPVFDQQLFFGSFARTIDATLAAVNTATLIQFDQTGTANGVNIDGAVTSRIRCINSGYYAFTASFQLASTNSSIKTVKMWYRKNGTDIPYSTSIRALETGTAVTVQTVSLNISMNANDYVELVWAADNAGVKMAATVADVVAPFAPASPSVRLQVTQQQQ